MLALMFWVVGGSGKSKNQNKQFVTNSYTAAGDGDRQAISYNSNKSQLQWPQILAMGQLFRPDFGLSMPLRLY